MALLLALAGGLGSAAPPPPPSPLPPHFRSVPVPRGVVASLAQDTRGLLWVGTGNGLASWDGHRLQPLEREGRSAGERSLGWVRALAAAPDGRLWIGSEAEGLLVHEPASGRVRPLGSAEARHATVQALVAEGDGVWLGSLGGGLQHYQAERGFRRIDTPDPRVLALQRDPEGRLWVGHWQGLARLAVGGVAAEPLLRTESPVTALLALADGSLWLGRQDGVLGLLPAGEGAVQWFNGRREGAPGAVSALQLDAKGQLWVGRSRGGIELRDGASGALLQRLRASARVPGGLAGEQVTALLCDAAGAMWVGGLGLGLQRQADSPALQLRGPDAEGPLRQLDARALLARQDPDAQTELLVATHEGPLLRLDTALRLRGELPRPGSAAVEALAEDAQGRLWLADGQQLECRERDGRPCGRWPAPGGTVNRLRPLSDGSLWLAGQEGLYVLRPGTDGAPRRVLDADGQPLVGEAFAVVEAAQGVVWAGSVQGLWRGQLGSLRVQRVAEAPGEGLASPIVIGLLSGRDGRLWLDTSAGGLHRLQGLDGQGRARFDRISERHGSAGRPFGANLQEDAQGRIWSQAFVYEPASDRLEELREAEGLALGTPWFFSEAALPDGRLVFGGSRGLLVLQPALHGSGRAAPPLLATALRVDGLPRALPATGQTLELPPLTRGFSLEFAALDYAAPERLRYRHRLEGHDPDWLETDATQRLASYGQLPPGHYLLRVQTSNRQGLWEATELRLPVHMAAAWWQQPWAKGLLVLALLLAVRAWTGWRTRRLRAREAELQALVAERTQALRDAALTDPLTGLKNRRYLMQRIEGDLRLSERRARTAPPAEDLIVFLIDLDHFKLLNDTLGHAAGDAALQQTAERLRSVFRDSDMLLRWGGEEFLVVAQGSRREAAAELAERLRRALADAPMLLGPGLMLRQVTASIGFAVYPPDPAAPEAWRWDQLLQLADAAMYAAKAAGRNTWVGVRAAPGVLPGSVPQGAEGAALLERAGLTVERPRT